MIAGSAQVILRVSHLTKTYRGIGAVRDASFSVLPGEVLGLIGPNGSGKTTLFGCLGGVLPYDTGWVETSTAAGTPAIFYLPDAITPWPEQTVEWSLTFARRYFRASDEMTPEWLERLGLQSILRKRIRNLSKGQRKRALLAVGLITPHPILLLDEPFDGLDMRQTPRSGAALRSSRGTWAHAVPLHPPDQRCRRASAIVSCCLSEGRVCGEGTLEELAATRRRCAVRPGRQTSRTSFLRSRSGRTFTWLLDKEWRELMASRSLVGDARC